MKLSMRLYQRGRWFYVEFYRGKSKSLKTKDQKKANELFREIEKEYLRGRLIDLEGFKKISLSDFSKLYIKSREGVSHWTVVKDELSLKLLADVVGGSIQLRAITRQKIEDFKRVCLARHTAEITVNGYLRHIKSAFSWAIDEGYLKQRPKVKMYKKQAEKPRVLEPGEIKKILRKAFKTNRDDARRFFFHLWTGTRRREACGLTWTMLNFEKNEITVIGKGGKKRTIPMLEPVKKMMVRYRRDIGKVFNDLHADTVSHRFHEIADACKVTARLHDLRHTCATYLLKNSVPLEVVQTILGHEQISTTQIYAKVLDEVMKTEMKKLRFK